MPIKSLESYLFERKLANTSSIEILQNATIGIDVDHYLSRIYTFKKEQFLSGIGGIPSSLKDYILSDLQVFREFNIKPIFVISGLNIQLQMNNFKTNELSAYEQHLENTWSKLTAKQQYSYNNIESFRLFNDPLPIRPMINDLIKLFIETGIDYLISPYDSSFQLSYLYQSDIIDSVYGSTDLLLTKIDKFILGMEFQSKDFRFIDKQKVLLELGLTERQFIDISLMVGCTLQPVTFPNFPSIPKPNPLQPYPQLSHFKLGLDIVYQYNQFNQGGDLLGYIMNLNDPRLVDLYFKGHSAIKYIPVLNKDGYVQLYNVEMAKLGFDSNIDFLDEDTQDEESEIDNQPQSVVKIPNDIHEIISQRLPPELYYYQSIGLLPLELLESIVKGQFDIRPNLEIGLNDSFKSLINSKYYLDNLDYQFNLLTQLLARYYQVKTINVKFWYKDELVKSNTRLTPPISKRVNKLFIQNDNSGEKFSLIEFFKQKLDGNYSTDKEISTVEDIISTVMLRTLYLFKIIDDKSQVNSLGKVLVKYCESQGNEIDNNQLEHLILILFLIQSKTLKLNDINREFSTVSKLFKDANSQVEEVANEDVSKITLISRIFSLVKFNISPINYQGPISRNLLNFRSHLKFINNHIINSLECLLVDFIVHQEQNNIKTTFESKSHWYGLINQLPFYHDLNNTLLGILAEIYFEVCLKQPKSSTREDIIKHGQDHLFNHVYQVQATSFNINVHGMNSISADQLLNDFKSGVKFWNQFVELSKVVNEVDKSLIDDGYLKSIIEADELVKRFS
ncbi:uncharacterized protein J8A68_000457 [[Candida] subhashii]|uniref:XPG-I domain-containing protein n=1 Tax=[Candida] subhashii TaxID=561895 RepID=A0A8J5QN32_9ASCO|nr:uncharacterized protein J8A68_000457 [[Candida] subhashii]KAG7666027.1 hypothetical protein J8A68_000457 [[Candida] subhashii]